MVWRVLVTERAAQYRLTKDELAAYPSRLCADVDVQYDDATGVGQWDGTYASVWYEWHVGDPVGSRRWFCQREYIPLSTFLKLNGNNVLLVLWLVIAALYNVVSQAGIPQLTELAAAYPSFGSTEYMFVSMLVVITIGVFGLIVQLSNLLEITDATRAPNPLLRDREQNRTENRRSRAYSEFDVSRLRRYELGCGYAILALALVLADWRIAAAGAVGYSSVLVVRIGLGLLGFNAQLLAIQRRVRRDGIVPQLSKRSIQIMASIGSPIVVVAGLSVLELDRLLGGVLDLVLAVLFAWLGIRVARLTEEKYRAVEYYDFVENPDRRPHPLGGAIGIGCHLLVNAVVLGSLLVVWTPSLVPIDASGSAFTFSVWVATALALVIPVGSWYQYADTVRQTETLLEESRPYDLGVDGVDLEYPVKRYEDDDCFATAVVDGDRKAIVVSQGAIDLLDDEEVAAVAAHEAGHLVFDDAALVNRLTLIASATMIGRNVLFDLVDFYGREFRADEHAVRRVDPDWLVSGLETWEEALEPTDATESIAEDASVAQPDGLAAIGPAALRHGKGAVRSNTSAFGSWIESRLESAFGGSLRAVDRFDLTAAALVVDRSRTMAHLEAIFDETFGVFYTGFTLTRAHPSVSERVAKIDAHAGSGASTDPSSGGSGASSSSAEADASSESDEDEDAELSRKSRT